VPSRAHTIDAGVRLQNGPVKTIRAALGSIVFLMIAPGVVAGLVPWLLTGWSVQQPLPFWHLAQAVGIALLVVGTACLLFAFARFVHEGLGTPAPVAPTEHLVVGGLYRYVRNPMYLAVAGIIVGQALVLGQPILVLYAAAFMLAVWAFVHWYEEPTLRRRYGDEYEAYRRAVPGWRPRTSPWTGASQSR